MISWLLVMHSKSCWFKGWWRLSYKELERWLCQAQSTYNTTRNPYVFTCLLCRGTGHRTKNMMHCIWHPKPKIKASSARRQMFSINTTSWNLGWSFAWEHFSIYSKYGNVVPRCKIHDGHFTNLEHSDFIMVFTDTNYTKNIGVDHLSIVIEV